MWEWVRRVVLHSLCTSLLRLWKWAGAFWYKNGLLTLSMLSVVTGCLLGFLLRTLELTDLVSLVGWSWEWSEGDGVGQGQALVPVRIPDGHSPKSKGSSPRKPPQGRFLPVAFFFFFFFFYLIFFSPRRCQMLKL